MSEAMTGWPFWAPSDLASVEQALDLADLRPGERCLDLGCGDGQVLVAAGRRGALVRGVECDPGLADQARAALATNGIAGEVVIGDLFDHALDLDADVIFTYLAPATLQRLLPRLDELAGTRLVTVDFAVPDLEADDIDGQAHLYLLPGEARRPTEPGWHAAGTLVVTVPHVSSLTTLELRHRGGPVELEISADLLACGTFLTGTDVAAPGCPVALDIRWDGLLPGTLTTGALVVPGLEPHHVTVCFAEHDEGQWDLSSDGVRNLSGWLASTGTRIVTPAELLAAVEG
jgi:hypothetical protein